MIYRILFVLILLLGMNQEVFSQREFKMQEGDTTYVMKRYVFMLLNEGPKRDHDSITAVKIQEGHMNHLNAMAKTGKLAIAGPFQNGGKYRGILIFDVDSISEAIRLESADPAILSGRLEMEAIYWWAAKGSKLP
ncbi:MAG TPA: hypothetical protein DHV48_18100 [Prolixibacteraceae bacterium]|nr:MAG: hypothetical protein A2066_03065 [Bacteroidetes bacterium GWB2_41_8]HCY43219.1 hypothetical protein [Prolixibacteraceae bacterium]